MKNELVRVNSSMVLLDQCLRTNVFLMHFFPFSNRFNFSKIGFDSSILVFPFNFSNKWRHIIVVLCYTTYLNLCILVKSLDLKHKISLQITQNFYKIQLY